MKEFLLLPAVGGIFIFMYEMLKKFDAFCDANRQNLWLEEDAVPEEKEESAEQVMDDCLSSSVSAERNGRLEKLLAAFQREKKVQNFRDLFTSILILLAASVIFFQQSGFCKCQYHDSVCVCSTADRSAYKSQDLQYDRRRAECTYF